MNSVFEEIEKIRGGRSANIIESLTSRYTVLCQETDRTKTAYCFSVPVRNIKTNGVVDLRFHHSKYGSVFYGSEAKITVTDRVEMINQHGRCDVVFQGKVSKKTETAVYINHNDHCLELRPTLNGLLLILDYDNIQSQPTITLQLDRIFGATYTNGKVFSIIRELLVPFVTVSCIGVLNAQGSVLAPCELHCKKVGDLEYAFTFSSANKTSARIAIEVNIYEPKLFHDTTVESLHPEENNAFGGIAFLGESKSFGEQWLYSRLEISNIAHLQRKKIIKTVLHIPKLSRSVTSLTVNRISTRFCSFGSTWQNKISITDPVAESFASNGYYHIDVTNLLGNLEKKSENYVIRTKNTDKTAVIPTADNFYTPQILEVQFQ